LEFAGNSNVVGSKTAVDRCRSSDST